MTDELARAFCEFARVAAAALFANGLPIAKDIGGAFLHAADAATKTNLRGAEAGGVLLHFPPAEKELRAMIHDFFGGVAGKESANESAGDSENGSDLRLLSAAAALSPHLFWRAAGNGKAPVAATELIGPSGVAECAKFRAGLFFQPAKMFYEWHRHSAEEIYLPLGNDAAEWSAEGKQAARVYPPQFVHHRSWQPHAMRTFESPLCAIWGWRGDIAMEHYELCPAPGE